MTARLCPRCQASLPDQDEGSLVFCWNCGAPQVRLSEELLTQAEQMQRDAAEPAFDAAAEPPPHPAEATAPDWKSAIRLSAGISAAFSFFSLIALPLALIVPPVVLAFYAARHKQTQMTASFGARVGLLCGLFTAFGISVLEAIGIAVLRFGMHGMGEFDARLNAILTQMRTQAVERSGKEALDLLNPFFTVPEFRVGLYLAGLALFMGTLIVLSAAGGALAGLLRSRRKPVTA